VPAETAKSLPMRVLVVEDERKTTAAFVRKALQAEAYAIDVCYRSVPDQITRVRVGLRVTGTRGA